MSQVIEHEDFLSFLNEHTIFDHYTLEDEGHIPYVLVKGFQYGVYATYYFKTTQGLFCVSAFRERDDDDEERAYGNSGTVVLANSEQISALRNHQRALYTEFELCEELLDTRSL